MPRLRTQVRVSLDALGLVRARGGRLFVYREAGELRAATAPPAEGRYLRQPAGGLDLYLPQGFAGPSRLRVELRALPEPHLVVWDDDLQR